MFPGQVPFCVVMVIVPLMELEVLFVAVKEGIPVAEVGPEERPILVFEFVHSQAVETGLTLKVTPFVISSLQADTSLIA